MKRILIFSLAYYPRFSSGAEVAIQEITDRIDPSDIEFHMITLLFDRTSAHEERIGNVHIHRVGFGENYLSKMFYIPLAALKARSLHTKFHFDALWSMMTYMLLPVVSAKLLGVKAPHILTLQDGDSYEKVFERWFIRPVAPLLNAGFRNAAIVQAISTYLATWPARRGYKGLVEVIPNGFSVTSAQEYPADEIEQLKQAVGKKWGDVFLISISRLVHQKGIDVVIRALPLLPPRTHLLVVGDGPDRQMLENLARELRVSERVVLIGKVDRTMTAKYRKVGDIFVSPSRSEGQGIAFLSTMVAGLPIVATQEGGIVDFLFDAKRNPDKPTTGWAVDKDNPKQIAEAVTEILTQPDQTRKVVATAKKFAQDNFDWNVIAKNMREKVFGRVLTK
ncbi:glycosyltransferase family 4 protein [Candidatus Kaiserbacteria bacterium]|nr:glycosyltransferase family 4 protein [Candidatus Kaiserbacteria bacterium]